MKTKTNLIQIFSRQFRWATALITLLIFAVLPLAQATEEVPLKGTAAGAITSFEPGPDGVTVTVRTQGYATHLGRFTREEMLLLNPVTMTFTGRIVFTAANGDQLIATVAGAFVSETEVMGTYTLSGGTGRFAQATGEAEFAATLNAGIVGVAFDGTVSSVGSNK